MISIPMSTQNMFHIGKVAETKCRQRFLPVEKVDPVSSIDEQFTPWRLEKMDAPPPGGCIDQSTQVSERMIFW